MSKYLTDTDKLYILNLEREISVEERSISTAKEDLKTCKDIKRIKELDDIIDNSNQLIESYNESIKYIKGEI